MVIPNSEAVKRKFVEELVSVSSLMVIANMCRPAQWAELWHAICNKTHVALQTT